MLNCVQSVPSRSRPWPIPVRLSVEARAVITRRWLRATGQSETAVSSEEGQSRASLVGATSPPPGTIGATLSREEGVSLPPAPPRSASGCSHGYAAPSTFRGTLFKSIEKGDEDVGTPESPFLAMRKFSLELINHENLGATSKFPMI